ncbi:MAG TPA: trehalose-6-phosphate synthase [Micromonosporaceae bacterium]
MRGRAANAMPELTEGGWPGRLDEASHAALVLLTDVLPAVDPDHGATHGLHPLLDDPATGALAQVVRERQGVWIGRRQAIGPWPREIQCRELELDAGDVHSYDAGHAQQTIWPLYHDLVRPAVHERAWRSAYRRVNKAYASAAARAAAPGATVWVHDFHLQLVPWYLRRLRPDLRIGFFLHTSFPAATLLEHMPMHEEIVRGLLGADVVGFQSAPAAENFLRLTHDLPATGDLSTTDEPAATEALAGVYPLSVDAGAIAALAARADIAERAAALRRQLGRPALIILSLDSADESYGIERRLRAIGALYRNRVLQPDQVALIQLVSPSRSSPPDLGGLTGAIAREAARINGEFASVGRPCLHYVVDTPTLADRVALYRAADILLATPLREGASVPAMEFVAAARPDSAVVLSQFTGSSALLAEAFLANPYDDDELRTAVSAALVADAGERARRLRSMREFVRGYDNHAWANVFLSALGAEHRLPEHRSTVRRRSHTGARQRSPVSTRHRPH